MYKNFYHSAERKARIKKEALINAPEYFPSSSFEGALSALA
jgi:hypothetical protein